ncbi:hypothetical protein E3N88_16673 [Mikania micrantha]|uniref:Uncharacterized protein n=1 Tax=Mikania micrantha TaxID=192012 RepID=A0A5N6P155_9ASTR|nr:hypothetical protein E3N88_16673 [Mikania micrantha]
MHEDSPIIQAPTHLAVSPLTEESKEILSLMQFTPAIAWCHGGNRVCASDKHPCKPEGVNPSYDEAKVQNQKCPEDSGGCV